MTTEGPTDCSWCLCHASCLVLKAHTSSSCCSWTVVGASPGSSCLFEGCCWSRAWVWASVWFSHCCNITLIGQLWRHPYSSTKQGSVISCIHHTNPCYVALLTEINGVWRLFYNTIGGVNFLGGFRSNKNKNRKLNIYHGGKRREGCPCQVNVIFEDYLLAFEISNRTLYICLDLVVLLGRMCLFYFSFWELGSVGDGWYLRVSAWNIYCQNCISLHLFIKIWRFPID